MNRPSRILGVILLLAGCDGSAGAEHAPAPPAPAPDGSEETGGDERAEDRTAWDELLARRAPDYSAALRTATLRLRGELPDRVEVSFVADAADPRAAYEAMVDAALDDPRLARELVSLYRDTFKMGGTPALDTAPAFAAQLVVEDRPFDELLTAERGACPAFDEATGTFTAGDCDSGAPRESGVLTNPAVLAQFASNLAFRRVRWAQETFACRKFPAEVAGELAVGEAGGVYTAPWPWDSIAGADTGGRIDFHDVSSVICANCHATLNHVAPLFAPFDATGHWTDGVAVTVPVEGLPFAVLEDWLPPGQQQTAWRFGVPAPDLPALGAAMARDPEVAACTVARVWNFAFGRGDVVAAEAEVPEVVVGDALRIYEASGHRLRDVLRAVFTSDDFVRFPRGLDEAAESLGTDGPPDVMARLHGCPKMKYETLGRVLASRGVDLGAPSATSAGALWRGGDQALGAAQYGARVPESLELTTASASRLLDIFVQAAPELVAHMPERPECVVAGEPARMFDDGGHCTPSGVACLTGLPATPAHLELCNEVVARASTPAVGRTLAVAALAAAAHTCE